MSETEFNKVFSIRLKYYLNCFDMTQAELSKRLGVGTTSVSNWCKGLKSPRMDKVDSMCEIFHCRRSDLMELPNGNVSDEVAILSPDENALFEDYKKLNAIGRKKVREYAADLVDSEKYIVKEKGQEGPAQGSCSA